MTTAGMDEGELLRRLERLASERGAVESLWRDVRTLGQVGSTQDVLSEMEAGGAPEGTVVAAFEQKSGRGRHGRLWHSAPGLGLYVSVLLRPGGPASGAVKYSLGAAIAACEALRRLGVGAEIKWPNDLVASKRKIAGLLLESRSTLDMLRAVLIGCGVNIGHQAGDFPPDLAGQAISLAMEGTCREPDSTEVCALLLDRLDVWYRKAHGQGMEPVLDRFAELSPSSQGRGVTIREGGRAWHAVTRGLAGDGALLVETPEGTLRALRLGEEITVREAVECCS